MSSPNSFVLDFNLLGRKTRKCRPEKGSGPKIEPGATSVKTGLHDDVCPFKTTL